MYVCAEIAQRCPKIFKVFRIWQMEDLSSAFTSAPSHGLGGRSVVLNMRRHETPQQTRTLQYVYYNYSIYCSLYYIILSYTILYYILIYIYISQFWIMMNSSLQMCSRYSMYRNKALQSTHVIRAHRCSQWPRHPTTGEALQGVGQGEDWTIFFHLLTVLNHLRLLPSATRYTEIEGWFRWSLQSFALFFPGPGCYESVPRGLGAR